MASPTPRKSDTAHARIAIQHGSICSRILATLAATGSRTAAELVESVGFSLAEIEERLNVLAERGLVEPDDQARRIVWATTESGRTAAAMLTRPDSVIALEPDGMTIPIGFDAAPSAPVGNPHEAGQPAPITGYRKLAQAEVDAINRVKAAADGIGHLCADDVGKMADVDKRWLAIAQTHLQQGFMALNRAIARPTSF